MGARVLFATSFNRLPKVATSSVLGDAHPHGPNNLWTQLGYSPAAVPPGLSTCPRVLAIEQVLLDLPTYLSLPFLTQKPAFLLCGGVS